MISAVLLALLVQSPSAPISAAEPLPQIPDIQRALADNWIRISSSGMVVHDYAVRNLICSPSTLPPQPEVEEKDKLILLMSDKPVAQVRCSYDYAKVLQKSRSSKKRFIKPAARYFSDQELNRIPKQAWTHDERDLVRVSRTACRYMGRTPRDGECNDYWVIRL
jgi:hypothetical protein